MQAKIDKKKKKSQRKRIEQKSFRADQIEVALNRVYPCILDITQKLKCNIKFDSDFLSKIYRETNAGTNEMTL